MVDTAEPQNECFFPQLSWTDSGGKITSHSASASGPFFPFISLSWRQAGAGYRRTEERNSASARMMCFSTMLIDMFISSAISR